MHGETKYYHPYKAHVCSVLKGYHVDPISIPCPHSRMPQRLLSTQVFLLIPSKQSISVNIFILLFLYSAVSPPSPLSCIPRVNMLIPFYEL